MIEYRELTKVATRDERLLKNIENQLIAYKLENARQQDPWELISEPTINDGRLLLKKAISFNNFFFSIIFSSFLAMLRKNHLIRSLR